MSLADSAIAIQGTEGPNPNDPSDMVTLPLRLTDTHVTTHSTVYSVLNNVTFESLVGTRIDQAAGTQEFTLTFSRPVQGLIANDFTVTDTIASSTPTISIDVDSTTATDTYVITTGTSGTVAERVGESVTLTLNDLSSLSIPPTPTDFSRGTIIALSAPESVTQQFEDLEPPVIMSVARVGDARITDTVATTQVSWTVTFDEVVTGFDAGDLSVTAEHTLLV